MSKVISGLCINGVMRGMRDECDLALEEICTTAKRIARSCVKHLMRMG